LYFLKTFFNLARNNVTSKVSKNWLKNPMQNLEDLKEKIFFEAKNILDTLSKINSADEFLMKKDLIEELSERVSFLKVLEKNENYFNY